MQHASRSSLAGMAGLSTLVALPAAWLTGCSTDLIAGMGSEVETAPPHGQSTAQLPGPDDSGVESNALVVSPQQQNYLDALRAAGVAPSSDLSALSIGSYVCQARAARQTDEAVWDFVVPLVRNDVGEADDNNDGEADDNNDGEGPAGVRARPPVADDIAATTADYIRIATDRLC